MVYSLFVFIKILTVYLNCYFIVEAPCRFSEKKIHMNIIMIFYFFVAKTCNANEAKCKSGACVQKWWLCGGAFITDDCEPPPTKFTCWGINLYLY